MLNGQHGCGDAWNHSTELELRLLFGAPLPTDCHTNAIKAAGANGNFGVAVSLRYNAARRRPMCRASASFLCSALSICRWASLHGRLQ